MTCEFGRREIVEGDASEPFAASPGGVMDGTPVLLFVYN